MFFSFDNKFLLRFLNCNILNQIRSYEEMGESYSKHRTTINNKKRKIKFIEESFLVSKNSISRQIHPKLLRKAEKKKLKIKLFKVYTQIELIIIKERKREGEI